MNRHTATLYLCLCMVRVWAPAHAQNVDTGVVRFPQDIIYKELCQLPTTRNLVFSGTRRSPVCTSTALNFCRARRSCLIGIQMQSGLSSIVSGTLYFAVGEQWDESKLKAYPAGTLYSEPSRTPHYAWAKDGEVVVVRVIAIRPAGNVPVPPIR